MAPVTGVVPRPHGPSSDTGYVARSACPRHAIRSETLLAPDTGQVPRPKAPDTGQVSPALAADTGYVPRAVAPDTGYVTRPP